MFHSKRPQIKGAKTRSLMNSTYAKAKNDCDANKKGVLKIVVVEKKILWRRTSKKSQTICKNGFEAAVKRQISQSRLLFAFRLFKINFLATQVSINPSTQTPSLMAGML